MSKGDSVSIKADSGQVTMRDTSVRTYSDLKKEGVINKMQGKVYNAIKELNFCTDSELADYLNYSDPNKVRPRRKELFDLGLVSEAGKRTCNISGRMAYLWEINESGQKKKNYCATEAEMKKTKEIIKKANLFQLNTIEKMVKKRLNFKDIYEIS